MINKLTRKRPNRLLIARNNYFALGGQPEQSTQGTSTNNNSGMSLASGIASIGMQAASDVGNLINNINSNDVTQKADAMIQAANSAQV